MKEKLVITVEVENLPEDCNFIEFQILSAHEGWLTKVFKDWRRIKIHRCLVTDLKKETS